MESWLDLQPCFLYHYFIIFCYINALSISKYNIPVYITNSIEQNHPWEANSRSATQEILRLLSNLEVHYSVHKSPPHESSPQNSEFFFNPLNATRALHTLHRNDHNYRY
jgi:hypothetical protein